MQSILNLFGLTREAERTIPWGPWQLPLKKCEDHFMFMGTAGCGKTLSLTQQYATVLPHITPDSSERVIIYDKKGDTLPILWSLKNRGRIHPETQIYFFNPQDDRCHAWDVQADVSRLPKNQLDTPFHRIVTNLFPLPKGAHKETAFYHNKLVELTKLVLHGFAAAEIPWTLRDVFAVLFHEERRKKIVSLHPLGQASLAKLGDRDVIQNVEATLAADLVRFGELANLMQLAFDKGNKFSIHQLLSQPAIFVFSGTSNDSIPLAHLNRTFFTELVEFLERRRDTATDITWIFLDEAASLGRQEKLPTLLRECRSKGASVFLGIQDIAGFRAALGNRDDAESVLAQVKNVAFYKLPDYESAEWASLRCGEWRRIDPLEDRLKTERRFNFTHFQDLRKFQPGRGLEGVFRTSDRPPMKSTITPLLLDDLNSTDAWPPLGTVEWPGDAVPKPNEALEQLLGASATLPRLKKPPGQPPTTGRVGPAAA